MAVSYLLQEDGASKILLEDESGAILLEGGDGGRTLVNRSLADASGLLGGILCDMTAAFKEVTFNSTVRFLFTTNQADGAAVAPSTAFDNADVRVYKDGGATELTAGITVTSPFDGITGLHQVAIDLSAGSYDLGSYFEVVLKPDDETVEGKVVVAIIGSFRVVAPEVSVGMPAGSVGAIAGNAITAASIATDAVTEVAGGVWIQASNFWPRQLAAMFQRKIQRLAR